MGIAYLAEGPQGWAVVKTMWPQLRGDSTYRARLARELDAMRAAQSPYVADVLTQELDCDNPWFAMEFVPGVTLRRRVEESGPLPPDEVRTLAAGLANAIAAIAAVGVVHRDLKPANVMLSPTGPRLIDFGVADIAEATQLTQTGFVVGSAGWLAPEQITGGEVTPATDVHAWGLCVLYAASGKAPFSGENTTATIYQVLHATPEVTASVREPLAALVTSSLAKETSQRPTPAQLAAALGTVVSSATTIERLGATTIAAVAASPGYGAPVATQPTVRPPSKGTGKAMLIGALAAIGVLALVGVGIAVGRNSSTTATPAASTSPKPVASTPAAPPSKTGTAPVTVPVSPTVTPTQAQPATTCAAGGKCRVGEIGPGGGTVFYAGSVQINGALQPGYLEVAPAHWANSLQPGHPSYVVDPPFEDPRISWCDPGVDIAGVNTQTGIGTGMSNTLAMLQSGQCSRGAAGLVTAYTGGGLQDWYLPSASELDALCRSRVDAIAPWSQQCDQTTTNSAYNPSNVPAFPYAYWSSTQTPDGTSKFALCQPCHDTASNDDDYRIPSPFYVRPIRVFAATQ